MDSLLPILALSLESARDVMSQQAIKCPGRLTPSRRYKLWRPDMSISRRNLVLLVAGIVILAYVAVSEVRI